MRSWSSSSQCCCLLREGRKGKWGFLPGLCSLCEASQGRNQWKARVEPWSRPQRRSAWGLFASGSSTCRTTTEQEPSILPEARLQNGSNYISHSALVRHQNLAKPSRYKTAVFTDASSDYLRQAAPYQKSLRSLASRVPTNAFHFAWFVRRASSTALAYEFFPLAMTWPNLWLWYHLSRR